MSTASIAGGRGGGGSSSESSQSQAQYQYYQQYFTNHKLHHPHMMASSTEVNSGPMSPVVLNEQNQHMTSLIWAGEKEAIKNALGVRRFDSRFFELYSIAPTKVRELLDMAGFGGVARVGYFLVDHSLVTALVERWRPETHTFHLSCGEVTITLQDIALLWGLPIDGAPIIGPRIVSNTEYWQDLCERLLGFRPRMDEITGNRMKKIALDRHLSVLLSPNASEEHLVQYSRSLALLLIGGLLFTDRTGNRINLRYLIHLENLKDAGNLSWGSGVLAYLYRSMCMASKCEAREISGPVVLLQLWAWERLPILRPNIDLLDLPELAPYGARWQMEFDLTKLSTHVLMTYRDQLDSMSPNQFSWMPYNDIIGALPERYLIGHNIWSAEVPLICWEIVELHCPDRVTRQFGLFQSIPKHVGGFLSYLHKCQLRGNMSIDWMVTHRSHLACWENRYNLALAQIPCTTNGSDVSDDYYSWYITITRILVGNLIYRSNVDEGYSITGSSAVILANAANACLDICEDQLKNISVSEDRVCFSRMKELLTRGLAAVGSSLGHRDAKCVFTGTENVVNPARRPKNRVFTRGAKGVKRGGKQRRPTNVDPSEDEEAFVFGSPSQSPHECLTLEYAFGGTSISQPPEDNQTQENMTSLSSQPSDDCIVEETIPCTEIRPRRVRKAVNRYTPG